MNIRYIENPTEKVQSVVLNADRDAAPFISSPTEEIKRLAMEMYGLRLENAAGKRAAAARTSETSELRKESGGGRGKETLGKADQRGGGETGQRDQGEINREYFQANLRGAVLGQRRGTGKRDLGCREKQEKKLVKAYEKFNSAAVPERKECNVGKIVKELRKERVAVENMKAGEWHSLMKGRPYSRPCFRRIRTAGKGKRTDACQNTAGYALKAAGTINQASRQANAEM